MTSRTNSAQSTLTNKSRLKLLQQREEHLQDLFSTARDAVDALARDEGRYAQFLEGAIVQGYLHLLEPAATVHARNKDVALAERAAGEGVHATKSHHHQAVDALGDGFVITGWSTLDDLPEAIEAPERRYALGGQWHPEADETSRLIGSLVEEARGAVRDDA